MLIPKSNLSDSLSGWIAAYLYCNLPAVRLTWHAKNQLRVAPHRVITGRSFQAQDSFRSMHGS